MTEQSESESVHLVLYIAGRTPRSIRAEQGLRTICTEKLSGDYRLDVIDVIEDPEAAERQKIFATPLLVRERPQPTQRLIGDKLGSESVIYDLDLESA